MHSSTVLSKGWFEHVPTAFDKWGTSCDSLLRTFSVSLHNINSSLSLIDQDGDWLIYFLRVGEVVSQL